MSDAQKLIADVHHYHQWRGEVLGCGCGWNWPEERTYFCGEEDRISKAHSEHVAAEIDKALGGLTRETRTNAMSSAGMTVDTKTGEQTWHSDIRRESRWASGWKEASQ